MSTKKKVFLISTLCLYAFAVFGQWIIVMTVHQGGYAKQAEMRLITLLIAGICVGAIRLLQKNGRIGRFWGLVFGVIITVSIVVFAGTTLSHMKDKNDSYYVGGWIGDQYYDVHWYSELDWQEERGKLWRLSHWFGRGEPWYPYDDAVLENAPDNVDWAKDEPYHSELDKRERVRHILWNSDADMLLNLLCHRLGRWVWCLYFLIALSWTGAGIALLRELETKRDLLLTFPALCLLAILLWLPTLSCLGLVYSYHGLLFTANSSDTVLLHYCAAAPASGLLLGLTLGEKEKVLLDRIAAELQRGF